MRLPFTRPGLVSRPRLQEQIAQGLRGPLTLVTAPAGFGKTTLVASCVAGCGLPVAWLSLDKNDNPTGRFLNYLIAALQEADPTIGSEAAQLAMAPEQAPPEMVLTSLVNDLDAAGREIALVLDDYHFISNPGVYAAVAFLLEHCPRTFHLVIASRSDPPLPLARLRARGQTVELRAADLRFTESESAQFLNDVMGLHLDAPAVALLEERTEGWIAGLQMAALSMRERKDVFAFIEGFSGTNRYILDYLLEEVLASQPPEVQRFLLYTSVLERLTAPLCDAILASDEESAPSGPPSPPPSAAMLEYLEQANLFLIPLDDTRCWYRYHHLFAALLQARLHQSEPERVARLLSRAAEWCEQDGQVAAAVNYALAARDYTRAGDLVAHYWGDATSNGEIETLWSWLVALPEDVVWNSAPLAVAYCWALWFKGQITAIEAHLVDAERALDQWMAHQGPNATDEAYIILPVMVATLHSIIARYNEDFAAACAHGERALALLPKNLPAQADAQLRGMIFVALASAYDGAGDLERAVDAYTETTRWSRLGRSTVGVAGMTYRMIGVLRLLGRLGAAETACREAFRFLEEQGMARLPAAGILHLAIAEVLLERNELAAVEDHLARGPELGKGSGRLDTVRNAARVLTRLRLAHGDASGALAAVEEAQSALEEPSPLALAELLALKAWALTRQGNLGQAAGCIDEAARLAGPDRGQVGEAVALAAARLHLAQNQPGEVVAELTRSLAAAEKNGQWGTAIEMHILRSLALWGQGDAPGAEAALESALTLAKPEGYVRVFLDAGPPMPALLAQWRMHADPGPLRDYALRLLSQFAAEPPGAPATAEKAPPAGDLPEPLSPRELEVLHLMALGRTNLEIARQLVVAPGTIKAHAASIYRKLDAANRTEAVARARQLGILP